MGRLGQSITLSLSEQNKESLQEIAQSLGITWGDKPNISKLIEAIAQRKLLIAHNNDWSKDLIAALQQAIVCLIDNGKSEDAKIISELLLKRSEPSAPLRREIERLVETSQKPNWRKRIDTLIYRHQPFQLAYQDAAQRVWSFNICYAHVIQRDRREYLECWCEKTEGNADLPALQHNWTLRLDRISDAAISPIETKWRSNLDYLSVEFHLFKGLSFTYEAKPNDTVNEWIPDQLQVRRVVRQISSTFWFFREIWPYGEDCLIVSPLDVHDQFRSKIQALNQRYIGDS